MKVYLAGPISGLTYEAGSDWRRHADVLLKDQGIKAYSPLRAKGYLSKHGVLVGSYNENPLSTSRGIMTRDRYDVMSADVVLFYLKGAKQISIGTCIEFGWADAFRKPTVVVVEPDWNVHHHPMISEATDYLVGTLEEAVAVIVAIKG